MQELDVARVPGGRLKELVAAMRAPGEGGEGASAEKHPSCLEQSRAALQGTLLINSL